jgi:cyclopropane fatty-acyl-phospholipid synthase-like methyltransferase
MMNQTSVLERLRLAQFPRSSKYDAEWILRHQMGPHPLWLLESLADALSIRPGMRVLDLGCGTALTSIPRAGVWGQRVRDGSVDRSRRQLETHPRGWGGRPRRPHPS